MCGKSTRDWMCLLFGGDQSVLLLVGLEELLLLLGLPLLPPPLGLLDLVAPGLGLVSQHLGPGLLGLLLVDVLHQDALVLEHVTLGLQVEVVVQVPVDLLGLTVAAEQTPQHSHPLHPQGLLGASGVLGTLALSVTGVTTLPPGLGGLTDAGPGVDGGGLLDGETVLDQLAHILAGVGVADLGDLVGVQPNLIFATFKDRGCQPLLKYQRTHVGCSARPELSTLRSFYLVAKK